MQAKKYLGQHWLRDLPSLEAMCDAARVSAGDEIFEIGPGMGDLTAQLMARDTNIFALEFDPEAVKYLSQQFALQWDVCLHVEQGDIRKFNFSALPNQYKIVANIPYYLTANLLRILTESKHKPAIAALLVQKEVAERVAAKPGHMSAVSVISQFYYEVSVGQVIPAKLFLPPPKVDSQILILKKRGKVLFEDVDQKSFFRLVIIGFANRRKTLLNSLSSGLNLSKSEIAVLLGMAKINTNARPQELSLNDWHQLFLALK
ncbi:MAG: 16S rRNA (adenine(1518)-N(6)/adenine(1519)-N(6))-dimethyltransferase RsmA [Patescibacteria group bacterium]